MFAFMVFENYNKFVNMCCTQKCDRWNE